MAFEGGILLSSGSSFAGQLGRPNGAVPWNRFGRVHNIRDVVVSVAAGWSHVLALTRTEVGWEIIFKFQGCSPATVNPTYYFRIISFLIGHYPVASERRYSLISIQCI